jgi:hypothetical protein
MKCTLTTERDAWRNSILKAYWKLLLWLRVNLTALRRKKWEALYLLRKKNIGGDVGLSLSSVPPLHPTAHHEYRSAVCSWPNNKKKTPNSRHVHSCFSCGECVLPVAHNIIRGKKSYLARCGQNALAFNGLGCWKSYSRQIACTERVP